MAEKLTCDGCGQFVDQHVTFKGRRVGLTHQACREKYSGAMHRARAAVETRSVSFSDFEIRSKAGSAGAFQGYANIFNAKDTYNTRFAPGSFLRGGLDADPYPLLWMHSPMSPIGVFRASEDSKGLEVDGTWDDTDIGRRARGQADPETGSAPELSVGFVRLAEDEEDAGLITSAELAEVSQVTRRMGSTPGAALRQVRAQLDALPRQHRSVAGSYEDLQEELREALSAQFGPGPYGYLMLVATFPDSVVFLNSGDMDDDDAQQVDWQRSGDTFTFGQPTPVSIYQAITPRAVDPMLERRKRAALLSLAVPLIRR